MRTNIVIDDDIMQAAMQGGGFKTKKEAVEAGLKLLARQAHYREVLKWEGKLHWDDQPGLMVAPAMMVMEAIATPPPQASAHVNQTIPSSATKQERLDVGR